MGPNNMVKRSDRRVVVSGVGVVSSIGIGKEKFWKNLIFGKTGVSKVESLNVEKYENKNGGEIKIFDPSDYFKKDEIKNIARASQFSIVATQLAVNDAKLDMGCLRNASIIMGTTMADIQSLEIIDRLLEEDREDYIWNANIIKYPSNELSSSVASYFKMNGAGYTISTACAAGNYSIAFAYDLLKEGKNTIVFAGGADPFSRITFTGFGRLFAMAPEKCQPFDKNRKGMIVGEGAGVLVLEELSHALARNADIYAEVLGYGLSCDATHMTSPNVEGIIKVMRKAINNSGLTNKDIDYICAHGTGTPANDKAECGAIKIVFEDCYKNIKVNSIKSMLGHTMGAASAIEAINCCLTIKNGIIAPTINFETTDIDCEIDCTPNKACKKPVKYALNNSLAFGGNNACLVLGKYE